MIDDTVYDIFVMIVDKAQYDTINIPAPAPTAALHIQAPTYAPLTKTEAGAHKIARQAAPQSVMSCCFMQ